MPMGEFNLCDSSCGGKREAPAEGKPRNPAPPGRPCQSKNPHACKLGCAFYHRLWQSVEFGAVTRTEVVTAILSGKDLFG